MKLAELTFGLGGRLLRGGGADISALVTDSRRACAGAAFLALRGPKLDGHRYIRQAYEAGARAFIVMDAAEVPEDAEVAVLPDTRLAAGVLAERSYGSPAAALWMGGITGTNGKTSITYLAEAMLRHKARSVGVIGTVNYRYGGRVLDAPNTTPGPLDLAALLAEMRAAGTTHVVMEVSSHALDQRRADGVAFDAALFTNLTRDHLDYHADMDEYAKAKRRLFTELLAGSDKPVPTAVVNLDDAYADFMLADLPARVRRLGFSLGAHSEAELLIEDLRVDLSGSRFALRFAGRRYEVASPLIGHHNVANLAGAIGLVLAAGLDPEDAVAALRGEVRIPGRLERVTDPSGRHVYVDYAHTPDALDNVLGVLGALKGQGRVITVFGCGGDRDKGKRPLMGKSAALLSDIAIATSDNPRSERPEAILDDIEPGLLGTGMRALTLADARARDARGYLRLVDRAEAIHAALALAAPGDIVLIAGKGHENYQIVGAETRHFDDVEVARECLLSQAGA